MRKDVRVRWSFNEKMFLRKYYRLYRTTDVADQLGRTVWATRKKASRMDLRKAAPSQIRRLSK